MAPEPNSPAWKCFDREPIQAQDGKKYIKCLHCPKQYSTNSATTVLNTHFRNKHPDNYKRALEQAEFDGPSRKKLKLSPLTQEEKSRLDNLLLQFVVLDFRPISAIEGTGFVNFVHGLEPRYKIPTRQTMTKRIDDDYDEKVRIFKATLAKLDHLSVTCDIWRSDSQNSLLAVTVHFIDPESLKLEFRTLGSIYLEGPKTGEMIADKMRQMLVSWDIMHKITVVVTDACSNIRSAVENFLRLPYFRCSGHHLQTFYHDALDDCKDGKLLVFKCQKISVYYKSQNPAYDLKCAQIQLGEEILKTKLMVDSRWNSELFMLERILEIRKSLTKVVIDSDLTDLYLTNSEWDSISDLVTLMRPIENATRELSGSSYTTLSLVAPIFKGLHKIFNL